MLDGVVGLQERAIRADFVDEVQGQRLVADLDRGEKRTQPGHDLVADGELGERTGEPRLQVAAVVGEVATGDGVEEERERGLKRRLPVHHLRVAPAGEAEHRQPVVVRQRLGHTAVVGLGVGVHEGPQVEGVAAEAGDHDGRALSLQLRQHDAGQDRGVVQGDVAGHRHGAGGAARRHGDPDGRKTALRQEKQLLQRVLVVDAGRGSR